MVTTSDGAVVTTSYSGNATTVTDQAGKKRRSITDGLGRLIRVDEPDSTGSMGTVAAPAQPTAYVYDVLDDLTTVTQGTQPSRSFVYDSLKRLTDATNPESGHVHHTYDANSNLATRLDARSITTTYVYDALNRVTSKSYSDTTPAVSYGYDAVGVAFSKGRLTSVSSSVSSYSYGQYDALGRVKTGTQTTSAHSYTMSYGYDLAGNMTSESYPSGRTVTTSYDSADRVSAVNGQKTGEANKTYASAFSYTAHAAVAAMTLGNNLVEHTNFNSRLQPTQIGLGTTGADSSKLKLDYGFGITNNNGNVLSQTITIGATVMSQSYGYDALNRLSSATETGAWTQTYDYDRFGNRAVRAGSYIPNASLTPQSAFVGDMSAFNPSNNKLALAGFGYDLAGNLTADPTTAANAMVYDAENRQISYTKAGVTTTYSYDGDGRRVKKFDGSGTTVFVYDVTGRLIAEYHSDPVPAGVSGGGTSYLTSDHLGSTRVVTDAQGNVKARHDYLPFGEELGSGIGQRTVALKYDAPDSTKQKFTQKERDSESGLDYFGARYYSSAQGRFTSVDPGGFNERTLASPQDWNRYAYTINNPFKFIDPDGAERLQVIVQTFIPHNSVAAPGRALVNNRYFEGDNRNVGEPGGFRTQQIINIETDPSKNGGNPQLGPINRDTGITNELSGPNGEVIDKAKASGETLGGEVTRDESGVNIHVSGNESNPLVSGAPGITYNFDIRVQSEGTQGNVTVTVTGEHDKFPAYEIIVSRPELPKTSGVVVYQRDPRKTGDTPLSLMPTAPHQVIKPPKTTRIRPDGSVGE